MQILARYCLPLILLLACQISQAAPAVIEASGQMIMTASAVRVRLAPDTRSDEVGKLALGVLVELEQQTKEKQKISSLFNYWFKVKSADVTGWVFGDFLMDFKTSTQDEIWESITRNRLAKSNLLFTDWTDLYTFSDQALAKVKNETTKGWLEFARLKSLQASFSLINFENEKESPYKEWFATHKDKAYLDEISAMWLVSAKKFWDLADKHAYTQLGDEMAWAAASSQLGGECEGDIECDLMREGMTTVEYIKRYPTGDHVAKNLNELDAVLGYIIEELKKDPYYFRVMPEMGLVIKRYLYAVSKTCGPQALKRDSAIKRLQKIQSYIP